MLYEKMTKEEKQKVVEEFVSICQKSTETEIRILYLSNAHFRECYEVTQKYFVEFFVEPLIEKIKPFLEVVAKIKKDVNEKYIQAIQIDSGVFNSMAISQTMSLGSR